MTLPFSFLGPGFILLDFVYTASVRTGLSLIRIQCVRWYVGRTTYSTGRGTGTALRPLTGFAVAMHVWLGSLATSSNCFFLRKFWPADVFDFVSFAIVFVV